jgi:hypothetical protein
MGTAGLSGFFKTNKNVLDFLIFLLPLPVFILVVYLRFNDIDSLDALAGEDRPFENLQMILILLATVVNIFITILIFNHKLYFRWAHLFATLMLFVWAMEEISWGQRIFGWSSGDFFEKHNFQKETTLHNLGLGAHLLDFGHFFIGFTGCLTILFYNRIKQIKLFKYFQLFLPGSKYFLYFFLLAIIYGLYMSVRYWGWFWWTNNMNVRELETAELFLALAVFFISVESAIRMSKNSKECLSVNSKNLT